MRLKFALFALAFPALGFGDIPNFSYTCQAVISQEWFGGTMNSVMASTDPFKLSNKEYSKGVTLKSSDFKNFVDAGVEEEATDSNGNKVKLKNLADFKGTNLENGFEAWTVIRSGKKGDKIPFFVLESMLDLNLEPASKPDPDDIAVSTEESKDGLPDQLQNEIKVYLNAKKHNDAGPIGFYVRCKTDAP